jgi:hypothetical protein
MKENSMAEIKAGTVDLIVDGKKIQIKTPTKRNFQLNKALTDPAEFKKFVADPGAFAKGYDLDIDPAISKKLSDVLKGLSSLDQLKATDQVALTAWAVASGVFSFATSKIAVVF